MFKSPPPVEILAQTRVIEYAFVDEGVQFTGRLKLYVGDERLGAVPCLAIVEGTLDPILMLLHCDSDWTVLGMQAWNGPAVTEAVTVEFIKRETEGNYTGVSSKWQRSVAV